MKFNRLTLLVPVALAVIIFLCWQLGLLKALKISVSQDGISCVSSDQLIQDVNIKGKLYWEIDQKKLETELVNKYPCIASASLHYKFPNQVLVKVQNRTPIASVIGIAPRQTIVFNDNEATPSSQSASLDWSFPELRVGNEVIDSLGKVFLTEDTSWLPLVLIDKADLKVGDDLSDLVFGNLSLALKKLPDIGVPAYRFKTEGSYLLADSKPQVALNLAGDISNQLASLQLILSKTKIDSREVTSIDLRFNKPVVVYSPKK